MLGNIEKLMIQVHGKTILLMKFKFIIKAHGPISWQIIYQKAQFSLAISKSLILIGNIKSPILVDNTKKSNSH